MLRGAVVPSFSAESRARRFRQVTNMKIAAAIGSLLFVSLFGSCAHQATTADTRRELDGQDAVIRELTRKNEELSSRELVMTTEIETLRAELESYRSGGGSRAVVNDLTNQISRLEGELERMGRELAAGMREELLVSDRPNSLASGDPSAFTINDTAFQTTQRADGLAIVLADTLLFSAGSADLRPEGRKVLLQLAGHLAATPHRVRVEGHSDDSPVRKTVDRYPLGNLQLSGDRALRVADFLVKEGGIPSRMVGFAGYGEHQPLVPNDSAQNRAKNRRVEIVVLNARQ
ncbi:MAG TPA: OmpA family protein [Planctomycetota bacterium]|nr:OmpA family protein [Planctomycetota bacterium]